MGRRSIANRAGRQAARARLAAELQATEEITREEAARFRELRLILTAMDAAEEEAAMLERVEALEAALRGIVERGEDDEDIEPPRAQ